VIDEGQVVEQGRPAALLADEHSRLRSMSSSLGPVAFLFFPPSAYLPDHAVSALKDLYVAAS
jgi:hypothetical protein